MPRMSCVVGGCSNVSTEEISLHRFPRDPKMNLLWTTFVQSTRADFVECPSNRSREICSEHFEEDAYDPSFRLKQSMGFTVRRQVLPGKYPTLKTPKSRSETKVTKHQRVRKPRKRKARTNADRFEITAAHDVTNSTSFKGQGSSEAVLLELTNTTVKSASDSRVGSMIAIPSNILPVMMVTGPNKPCDEYRSMMAPENVSSKHPVTSIGRLTCQAPEEPESAVATLPSTEIMRQPMARSTTQSCGIGEPITDVPATSTSNLHHCIISLNESTGEITSVKHCLLEDNPGASFNESATPVCSTEQDMLVTPEQWSNQAKSTMNPPPTSTSTDPAAGWGLGHLLDSSLVPGSINNHQSSGQDAQKKPRRKTPLDVNASITPSTVFSHLRSQPEEKEEEEEDYSNDEEEEEEFLDDAEKENYSSDGYEPTQGDSDSDSEESVDDDADDYLDQDDREIIAAELGTEKPSKTREPRPPASPKTKKRWMELNWDVLCRLCNFQTSSVQTICCHLTQEHQEHVGLLKEFLLKTKVAHNDIDQTLEAYIHGSITQDVHSEDGAGSERERTEMEDDMNSYQCQRSHRSDESRRESKEPGGEPEEQGTSGGDGHAEGADGSGSGTAEPCGRNMTDRRGKPLSRAEPVLQGATYRRSEQEENDNRTGDIPGYDSANHTLSDREQVVIKTEDLYELILKYVRVVFHCPNCERTIKGRYTLDFVHCCENSFKNTLCEGCGKTFSNKCYISHSTFCKMRKDHQPAPHPEILSCTICRRKLHRGTLKEHFRLVHKESRRRKKPATCGVCGKTLSSKSALRVHMSVHRKDHEFSCPCCQKGFTQATNLKVHMRQHTGEQPYKCEHCPKAFTNKVCLKSHLKRYHSIDLWEEGHTGGGRPTTKHKKKRKTIN